jgi:hypothetical protein
MVTLQADRVTLRMLREPDLDAYEAHGFRASGRVSDFFAMRRFE